MPKRSQEFKNELAKLVKAQYQGEPLKKELSVKLNFYKPINPTAKRYGDIDNLAKAVMDALNGILWADDSQIVELHGYKHKGAGKIKIEVVECT